MSPTDIQEIAACLGPLVNTQSLQDRQALQLVDISGGSQSAAAEQLGISRSGMESRVQRARARLRERLLACCSGIVDAQKAPMRFSNLPDCSGGPCQPGLPDSAQSTLSGRR